MSVSIFRLPPELIDLVIRENRERISTLRSCALVCRAFRRSSQGCIFASVDLGPYLSPVPKFHDLLRHSPHLCGHVRKLTISDIERGEWDAWYPGLAEILDLLDNVTTFALSFLPLVQWRDLPANLQAAICALCQRSSLVSLRLIRAGTLNSLAEFSQLVASPALKDLWLKNLEIPVPGQDEIPLTNTIALTNFEFELKSSTLAIVTPWLVDGASLSHVRSLSFAWTRENVSYLHALTHGAAANLEKVTLESHNATITMDFPPLRLGGLQQKLQKIRVTLNVDVNHSDRLPRELAVLLESCSASLTTISVALYLSTRNPNLPVVEMDWSRVAEIVTVARFPALQNLSLVLFPFHSMAKTVKEKLLADMHSGLSDLNARGILKCSSWDPAANPGII
ncbi:hypothetical protein C8F04DRAFT_1132545 [Mycena alexandri]|uniref:F-box domain-containing protein n=1 Tax=Mycena alexandri TaxID=1745969 RepID=A0AAD6SA05_9AGAR|nr:hypothetical protein C8F04DRAFT_1132545 [Mycena alexandri]